MLDSSVAASPIIPSWDQLATRLRPFVRGRVASEADADDVLQEVLLRMHRGLPGLSDEQRLHAWTYRIARHAIADHLRARSRHPLTRRAAEPDSPELAVPAVASAGDDDAVSRDLAQVLSHFVAQLPSPYRQAITLTDLEGRTQQQAADMLGISLTAMKSRVQRGRAKLRHALHACCAIALDARGKVISCRPHGASNCC